MKEEATALDKVLLEKIIFVVFFQSKQEYEKIT